MKIAVCGLGTMGAPMARHLLEKGHEVAVHNRTRSREEPLAALGATRADSPAAAARGAEVLVVCVSDTPDVESVLLGENGAIEGLGKGALVIDCSTIAPEGARRIAATLAEKGIGFVDAPVSGGSEGAEKGTLAIMCGSSDEDFARARPVLQSFGKAITHVGPVGCGQIAKAVNQVVISGTYQSVAEGIVLAAKSGADPRRVIAAIEHGAAASWILSNRSENMLEDEYPLGFRVRLHRKDLGIALTTAEESGATLPMASYVATVEDELIRLGHGDEDMSAIARNVRLESGLKAGPIET